MAWFKRTPRHKHQWVYHSQKFTPPVRRSIQGWSFDDSIDRMIFGFTTVTYVCSDEACPEWKTSVYIGQVSVPEDRLVQR